MPVIVRPPFVHKTKPNALPKLHARLHRHAEDAWVLSNSTRGLVRGATLAFGATTAAPTWGGRVGGSGLIFDGTNDIATGSAFRSLNGAFPVWIAGGVSYDVVPATARWAFALNDNIASGAFLTVGADATGVAAARFRITTSGGVATILGPAIEVTRAYHIAAITRGATDHTMYVNGRRFTVATNINTTWSANINLVSMGAVQISTAQLFHDGALHWAAYGQDDPGDGFLQELTQNPYRFLFPAQRRIWIPGASVVTGTVAATESNDTLAAAGQVLVSGTFAATETNDTLAAAGQVLVSGTLAATESNDTLAGTGAVLVSGTVATTESADTLAATGAVLVSGTAAVTESNDTLAASGLVASGPAGTIAATEADDTLLSSGSVLVSGGLASTEADDTLAASGTVSGGILTGTVAATEANDTLAAAGAALDVLVGTVAATEANDTMSAIGSNGVVTSLLDWTVTDQALYRWTLSETTQT